MKYYVVCGDIEKICQASSHEEAAKLVIKNWFDSGSDKDLGLLIAISEKGVAINGDDTCRFMSTELIMNELGLGVCSKTENSNDDSAR